MKSVFVSFDYENDRHYKTLLQAWDANDDFKFVFDDASSQEINSNNVARVKAALTTKINNADYTLVIVGKEANKQHVDRSLIGYRNWINFEVAKSVAAKNGLVGVKLNSTNKSPEELLNVGAKWAMSFTEAAIIKALNEA